MSWKMVYVSSVICVWEQSSCGVKRVLFKRVLLCEGYKNFLQIANSPSLMSKKVFLISKDFNVTPVVKVFVVSNGRGVRVACNHAIV